MSIRSRRYRLYLFYLCLLLPPVAIGAAAALDSNSNSPLDWVDSSFAPRASFDHFLRRFGSGDLLVIGWPGCRVDRAGVSAVEQALKTDSHFFDSAERSYFERVVSGRSLVQALSAQLGADRAARVARRLRGSWLGENGRSTVVVVALTPDGLVKRGELVDLVKEVVHRRAGVGYGDIHLAGPVMDGLTVDRSSQRALKALALPSSAVVLLLSWWFLGSLRGAGIVFGVSALAQGMTLSLVHYGGETMSALLIVLPPLVQVLAIAGGVHLANYYFGQPATAEVAARRAVETGWLPCLLSGGTTALGIVSLVASGLSPIRSFAVYGAAGVLITTVLTLTLVPGLLALLGVAPRATASSWFRSSYEAIHVRLARCVNRFALVIVSLFLLSMLAASWGFSGLSTSVRIETLFSSGSRILNDYRWLERHVGSLVPIEVLLEWDESAGDWGEQVRLVSRVERAIGELQDVDATLSTASWYGGMLEGRSGTEASRLVPLPPALAEQFGYLNRSDGKQVLRVTAFVSALKPLDYAGLLDRIERVVGATMGREDVHPSSVPETIYTGTMPLVHAIQRRLMWDLLMSFLGALGLVTVVMTLVQAGWWSGVLVMLPNIFPIVVLFGILGWRRIPLDIGSVMTASVALGIAVDDTLHFLVAYRRGADRGLAPVEAAASAYRHCGLAMVQTSVICGLGLLLFALSDFVPTRHFAWMMASLLGLALLGDLVLLPALLLSPLGRRLVAPASGEWGSEVETTFARCDVRETRAEVA